MKLTRKTKRSPDGYARCKDCDWGMECTRQRARLHAIIMNHTVMYIISEMTIYTPEEE